jgi:flagellar biosynthetic protein FliQ
VDTGGPQHRGVAEFESLLRDALIVTALLTIPILAVATLVGALVAILQAATQIQEQTLTLLPKVIAVGLAAALFGRFGLALCAQLLLEAVARIPQLVRG